jgi:ethanolamine utilization microcompartment shell protein EutL
MSSTTYNIVPGRYEKQLPVTTKAHFKSSTNSTNATSVKASAGTVFNMIIHNTHGGSGSGSSITIRFYDKATAPTVGTDVPMIIIHVGSSTSKEVNFTSGITFTNGIAYALTAGDSLLDATAVDADGVQVYMGYM